MLLSRTCLQKHFYVLLENVRDTDGLSRCPLAAGTLFLDGPLIERRLKLADTLRDGCINEAMDFRSAAVFFRLEIRS